MRTLRSLIPVVLVLLMSACADDAPSGPGGDLEGITWILDPPSIDALAGGAFPAEAHVTVRFEEGEVGGVAACNHYGGTYELDGGTIAISVSSMTEMACEEPLMTLESAFVDALGGVGSVRVSGDHLVLEGGGHALGFDPEQALPLEGTAWRLDGIGSGGDTVSSVLAGTEVTASFDAAGHVGGFGGCNEYGGSYETDGEEITFGEIASTLIGCPPDVSEQEGAFLDALGRAASFDIQGSTLTLLDGEGRFLLSFVAAS